MTDPYRAMCAELVDSLENARRIIQGADGTLHINTAEFVLRRARALLAQPEPEESKPVVDYSRVPEIATEAQIRSAAQYLVKKRNCDGDLIPAIEYAIARWGHPTPQPEPVAPTDEELTLTYAYPVAAAVSNKRGQFTTEDIEAAQLAGLRAVLAKWGHQ